MPWTVDQDTEIDGPRDHVGTVGYSWAAADESDDVQLCFLGNLVLVRLVFGEQEC